MDLLLLALAEDLQAEAFRREVRQAWQRASELGPCGLLLNHPQAQHASAWESLPLEAMANDAPDETQQRLVSAVAGRPAIEVRQLAACACCVQQGQLGLVLAGMYRRLIASSQACDADHGAAVLLVGTPQLNESGLKRGIRYLKPPPIVRWV